jgi:hypothetical protein
MTLFALSCASPTEYPATGPDGANASPKGDSESKACGVPVQQAPGPCEGWAQRGGTWWEGAHGTYAEWPEGEESGDFTAIAATPISNPYTTPHPLADQTLVFRRKRGYHCDATGLWLQSEVRWIAHPNAGYLDQSGFYCPNFLVVPRTPEEGACWQHYLDCSWIRPAGSDISISGWMTFEVTETWDDVEWGPSARIDVEPCCNWPVEELVVSEGRGIVEWVYDGHRQKASTLPDISPPPTP